MKGFLKFLNVFFVTLGVIFLILILVGVYLWKADPLGLKPMMGSINIPINFSSQLPAGTSSTSDHPMLTPEQEKTLQDVGIDPATLPTAITPEMEKCFTEKLGSARVDEIKAGASPGPLDLIKAGSCLQ